MSKYQNIHAALLGIGTVGMGVYKLLERRKRSCHIRLAESLVFVGFLLKIYQKREREFQKIF